MYDTKTFFNDRADVWDNVNTHDPEKLCMMLLLSDIQSDSVILDIGCGTGILEPYLLAYEPKKIIAVDFAENMIKKANEKLQHPKIQFLCSDFFQLSDISCNYCFFVSTFPHFPDQEAAVKHTVSLLADGGRITISNVQGKYCGQSSNILDPMLPAQTLLNLLRPYFRIDVLVDNRFMFLVSGTKLSTVRK